MNYTLRSKYVSLKDILIFAHLCFQEKFLKFDYHPSINKEGFKKNREMPYGMKPLECSCEGFLVMF